MLSHPPWSFGYFGLVLSKIVTQSNAMHFSCLVFLLTLWDASTEDEISWCLRAGSLCHGNKWTLKAVDQVLHYLPLSDLYPMRLADWDMDGDLDAIVLMEDGLWLFKMIARGQNFSGPFLLNNSALNVNYNSYLEVADWNGDGYPDILFAEQVRTISGPSGCTDGKIRYFEQMHLDSEMVLQERTGSNNPFDVISVPCPDRYTTLQLADWNADGKPDLFVYSPELIKLRYFENHHGQLLEATHRPGSVFHVSIEKRILVELLTSVLYGLTPMNQELIFCWH